MKNFAELDAKICSCQQALNANTYNSDGIRVSRTNGESTYNYTYLDGQLTHLTIDGHNMYFYYGDNGTPMALSFNGVRYYYVTSLQGDVIAIVDQNGTVVTTYLYDATA